MKNVILTLFLVASLAGCSAEYQEKIRKEQFEADAKKCESYGAKRGSDTFVLCMATLESNKRTIITSEPDPIPAYLYRPQTR